MSTFDYLKAIQEQTKQIEDSFRGNQQNMNLASAMNERDCQLSNLVGNLGKLLDRSENKLK